MKQTEADLLAKAIQFAVTAHGEQKRKYTNEPYVTHPLAVMRIVQGVPHTTEMLVAAVLHDVVEDTHVELVEIKEEFGPVVATYVDGLTDISRPEDGNRATRKTIDRNHTAEQPAEVQTIKLADLIHNTASIEEHDPNFYKVYKQEKIKLLKILTKGDRTLMFRAQQQIGGM
jgi:(p)ppGpp synthase/HD superfamily hydrolase